MSASPYDGLGPRAFWRTAVATRGPGRLRELHDPRFRIAPSARVFTAGSCFAQHVHRALAAAGFGVIDAEPALPGVAPEVSARFFYGTFSARFGNLYTARQFLQLIEEARGLRRPAHPVWTRDQRFFDALRPNVDPGGHASAGAVRASRDDHLAAVAGALDQADVVIFTLGLTEAWHDPESGTIFPSAPGVLADPPAGARISFLPLGHDAVLADLRALLAALRSRRPDIRLILTVSPVPLTATATGGHVLVASTASKAILRAAAASLMAEDEGVDYFPSYEIITNPAARGRFFAANLRSPTATGVRVVMEQFLQAHQGGVPAGAAGTPPPAAATAAPAEALEEDDDAICDEVLNDPALRGAPGGRR